MKQMIYILLWLAFLCFANGTQAVAAGEPDRQEESLSDSIIQNSHAKRLKNEQECLQREQELRTQLLTKSGPELLDTYASLFDLFTYMGAVDKQLELSDNFLAEAERQHNMVAMRYARVSRFYELYNNSYYTDMARVIEDDLAFYVKNNQWQAYYSEWTLYLQACLMRGRFSTALYGAQNMWDEAEKGNNNYGRGCSKFLIGRVNKEMGRNKEAERDLKTAIKYLLTYLKYDDNTLMDAYNILLDLQFENEQYGQMMTTLGEVTKVSSEWSKQNARDHETEYVYNDRLLFIYSYYVKAYLGLKDYKKAKEVLAKARNVNFRMSEEPQVSLLESEALYSRHVGDYNKAIGIYKQLIENYEDGQDTISILHIGMELGRTYESLGDYEQAANIFHQMQSLQETLRYTTSSWLMLDYKSEQNERAEVWKLHTHRVIIYGGISILVLIIAIIIVYVSMRLRFKRYKRMMDLALLRNLGLRGEEVISHEVEKKNQGGLYQYEEDKTSGQGTMADRLMAHMESLGEGDDARSVVEEIDLMTEALNRRPHLDSEIDDAKTQTDSGKKKDESVSREEDE